MKTKWGRKYANNVSTITQFSLLSVNIKVFARLARKIFMTKGL